MISIFKKVKEPYSEGGSGDGTKASPWYWHSLGGTDTVSVNNTNADPEDDCRLYFRIKLKGGTAYNISQTAPGGYDGRIYLYDEVWKVLDEGDDTGDGDSTLDDTVSYTPSADCICYVGAGNYSGDEGLGNYLVRVSPLPEYEAPPNSKLIYTTSSGFDEFGYPVRFDTAVEAGCNFNVIPEDGLVFYAPLDKEASTAVTGQALTKSGTVTYETVDGIPMARFNNGYINVPSGSAIPSGNTSRTISFFAKATGTSNNYPGLVYCGDWGRTNCLQTFLCPPVDGNILGCEVWVSGSPRCQLYPDGSLDALQHIAVTYNSSDRVVTVYRNGSIIGQSASSADMTASSELYIGIRANSGSGQNFPGVISAVRVYNRELDPREIKALSKEFKI